MTRLVSFGCSITYGYGLEDCYETESHGPSRLSWPTIIASELLIPCINKGAPGSSNKKISVETLNTDFEQDDIVVFLWTYTQRGLIFDSVDEEIDMMPSIPSEFKKHFDIKKHYYKVHTKYDLVTQSILDIHHANIFLSNKNIKTYNFFIDHLLNKTTEYTYLKLLKDIDLTWINLNEISTDLAKDNGHPGPLTQKKIANLMLEKINKDNL